MMLRLIVCLATAASLPPLSALAREARVVPSPPSEIAASWVPDEFVIVFRPAARARLDLLRGPGLPRVGIASVQQALEGAGAQDLRALFPGARREPAGSRRPDLTGHYTVKLAPGRDLDAAMAALAANPNVDHVEKIGIHPVFAAPNDDYFDTPPPGYGMAQWHYWDQMGVDADLAWDLETGDASVVVGILDTGVKYGHDDLGGSNPPGPADASTNGNIWVNAGETPGNSLDDDANGYVDDVVGWDFVSAAGGSCVDEDCSGADNDPNDGEGHGTHVSGTVAAITNNGHLVSGIAGGFGDGTPAGSANGCRIVCLRIGWRTSSGGVVRMDWAAQAMNYLSVQKDRGVNVAAINCSWGSSNSGGIDAAVNGLLARDVMVIAAAGNDASSTPNYLGGKAGVMNVAATTEIGAAASFTNYGPWVDLAAPGVNVLSTWRDPFDPDPAHMDIAFASGTSMAAPHAVGVAALLESYDPTLTGPEKFSLMVDHTKPYNSPFDLGAGIVDARFVIDALIPTCGVNSNFSATPLASCAPAFIEFYSQSPGSTSWSWDFGDGTTSTARNPVHEYLDPGVYSVALTVSNGSCQDTETRVDYITISALPAPAFEGAPLTGPAPLDVQFNDLSTGATQWQWDFGDGEGSIEQSPLHTYDQPGLYTVTLTATNECGFEVATQTDYITVTDPVGVPGRGPAAGRLSLAAWPNPLRAATELRLEAPGGEHVEVAIVDLGGRRVYQVYSGTAAAGPSAFRWDGNDASGQRVPAGLYFAVARTARVTTACKLAVVR
jgi:subtilisin family serine protease